MQPFQRVIHAFALIAIFCATVIASSIIGLSLIVSRFVAWETPRDGGWLLLPIGAAVLSIVLTAIGIYRRVSWMFVTVLALIPVSLSIFLLLDMGEQMGANLGARADDTDKLYRTVMWLAEGSPYSRLKEMPDYSAPTIVQLPQDSASWGNYVREHRAEISSEWQNLNLGREWVEALRTVPIHGVWYQPVGDPFPSFKAVRKISNVALAYAVSKASDGNSDAAIEILCSLLGAIQQVQRTGPTLVNQMICTVVVRQTLAAAGEILHEGRVSEPLRMHLKRTLRNAPPLSLIIRNAFEGEVEFTTTALGRAQGGENNMQSDNTNIDHVVNYGMRFLGPFLFNYNRTVALATQTLRDVERLSTARQLEDLTKLQPRASTGIQQLKNPAGRLLGAMIIPSFEKVVRQMWAVEDTRIALLENLEVQTK